MLNFLAAVSGNGAGGGGSFESIATTTLTTNTATVTLSAIPADYQHLQVRIFARNTRGAVNANLNMQLNSDSGANYVYHELSGDGSTVLSTNATAQTNPSVSRSPSANALSNVFGNTIIDIHDYKSTTKNKVIRTFYGYDNNSGTDVGSIGMRSMLWLSTSAITSMTFTSASSSSFVSGSTFALYGIKGA